MKVPIHDHDTPLVTVTSVNSAHVADIVCNALQVAGIPAQVDGEHQAGFTGALSIGILVRTTDVDRARDILRQNDHETSCHVL